jgi:hypothetical protein
MTQTLRELQKQWYKILEDSGFKDIEKLVRGELVLKQVAEHSGWYKDDFTREMHREYFQTITFHAYDEATVYRNETDKIIMQMHADGAKITEIMRALNAITKSPCRRSIRVIIRRYEMDWNIRQYTPKQLNKYE